MKTGKGLVEYASAQLGKPYWWGTFGQIATKDLLESKKRQYPSYYTAKDFPQQLGEKVHDCVGLIKGYLWCDSPQGKPQYNSTQDVSAAGLYTKCSKTGTINNIPEIPGICVFQANMQHVGVYVGNGYVIEARGHAYGVVKTKLKNRSWAAWGMPKWISYSSQVPESTKDKTVSVSLPVLQKGSKGRSVVCLQQLLLYEEESKSYIQTSGGADGEFGSGTEKAVFAYQASKSLSERGVVATETWNSLMKG